MDCESCQKKISSLMDGELPVGESSPIFGHLGKCETCRKFYYQLRTLNLSLGQLRTAGIALTTSQDAHESTKKSDYIQRLWSKQIAVRFPVAALLAFALAVSVFFSIQIGFKPRERETVYLTKLPQVVITANGVQRTEHQ